MLQPIGDRVIVKVKKEEGEAVDGIVLISNVKEKSTEGEVVTVGSGLVISEDRVLPMTVKEGDRVVYGKYSGINVKYNGEERLILHGKDILAIAK